VWLLEPMPKNFNRVRSLDACGLLAVELPEDSGYDLRGLYGLPVWLWASGPASSWLGSIGGLVRQARPRLMRVTYPGIGWQDVPLAATAEDQDRVPPPEQPREPTRTFASPAEIYREIDDKRWRQMLAEDARVAAAARAQPAEKPWWEEQIDGEAEAN